MSNEKSSKSIALANWSWRLFLAGLLLLALRSLADFSSAVNLTITAAVFTIHLCGVAVAIVALSGIRKYGKTGILIPAVVGLTLNMAIFVLAIAVFLALFAAFRAQYG